MVEGRTLRAPRRARGLSRKFKVLLASLLAVVFIKWNVNWQESQEAVPAADPRSLAEVAEVAAAAAEALTGAAPTLFGPVDKAGELPQLRWHPRLIDRLRGKFGEFMSQPRKLGVLTPEVWPGCAIWGNHDYRIIFVRHPKCATSAVLHHFTLCSEPNAKPYCLTMWSGGAGSPMANQTAEDMARMWRDYYVFTLVRNPLARAVSAYKFTLSAMRADQKGCRDLMDWERFCHDPLIAGRICRRNKHCCPFGPTFTFAHLIDQGRCMVTEDGGLAVDHIARVEHMDDDLAELIREVNRRRPQVLPPIDIPQETVKVNPGSDLTAEAKPSCKSNWKTVAERHGVLNPAVFFGNVYNFSSQVAKESAYCGLREFYTGRHKSCLPALSQTFEFDLRLLYSRQHSTYTDPDGSAGIGDADSAGGGRGGGADDVASAQVGRISAPGRRIAHKDRLRHRKH